MAVQNAFVTVAGLEAAAATETTLSYGPASQTIADLRAVPLSARADKQARLVEDAGATYRFDVQGVGADDGDLILAPDDGGPGRWFKVNPSSVPLSHAGSHEDGGADEIDVDGLSGLLADAQKIEPQDEGVSLPLRKRINFTGAGVVATDDPGNDRVNVSVPGSVAPASFDTQEDGASVQSTTTFLNARKGIIASAGGANQAHLDLDYGGTAELADADAGAEAPGTSDKVPRADHKHSIPTAAAGTILPDDAAAVGSAATLARSDHKHAIAADAPDDIAIGDAAAEGAAPSFARSDHVHGLPVPPPPVNVTKAAASAGAATTVARSDHKHDISTAVPAASLDIGDAAAEGAATTLARSDHQHAFPAPVGAPPAVAAAGAVGAATTPARSDHTHLGVSDVGGTSGSVGFGVPVNVDKSANAAGAAATVSRSDHKHDVTTAAAGTILPDDAAAEGVATSLARSDHTHAIAADVPVDVGTANAEGVGTAFSRNDHVHKVPLSAISGLLNASITEATGDITTTSATDVVATGMSVTPAAGTYLVWFGGSFESSTASPIMFASIYKAGVQVAASERESDAPGSSESTSFVCMALVTVNGAEAIDGRWRTTAATATMHERQLLLVRVA